jgi:hypothetical protein
LTRLVQIALLLAIAPPAAAQDTAKIAKQLQSDWAGCVNLSVQTWAPPQGDFSGPAESAFRNCLTEEQLFTAYVQGVAPEASRMTLVSHYKDKLALKKKIADDYFKALTKQMGKQ